ncbi:thiamine pyrophosphate-binding protein [Albimonas sp. CAU 1670]|uniref:thiamine pyrophosphate-binding protein n=1 Tax=Albimonas sp. CAU 1670 TaxID=3032599 RepID=UPI0023DBD977|nr:thiamine pyrophosphate-binding protein [Albimonas sp. CAU 1670]MDF2230927.1 thiamine pyrophosphate-binding protein [Albimonas sp. CAU 1670]
MTDYTVADLVAEFLDALGVRTAFGVISVHNIPMMDAISKRNAIRMIPTRGEPGAIHMADGLARASGGIGVMFSSTGPGAANAVGGLVEARFASTPLLHITGQTRTAHLGRGMGTTHDVDDQLGMLKSAGKNAWRVPSAAEALGVLVRAAREAMTPPCGPVSVEIPIDVQRAPLPRPAALDALSLIPPIPDGPTPEALSLLVELARSARRPMLWLGNGAAGAGPAARRLLDLGFAMVTSWNGRGVVEETHPRTLGGLNGTGIPMIEDFYATCDLMIVAGSRLRGHETADFALKLPERRVQIDVDPRADGRTYSNELFVEGDAGATLAALADALEAEGWRADPAFGPEFETLKTRARRAFAATLGPYAGFADQLRAAMPEDAIFARDITINHSTWGNRLMPVLDPTTSIYPVGAGIGQGFSLAVGAALADGRKTVCMTGDGGFFLNLGELWTAVQERADMVILVMNDAGYGVIRHIQDATGAGRRYESFTAPSLEGIAALAGIPFHRVSDPARFGETVAKALAHEGPSLVEVDMTVIGEHPPYFPYGPRVEAVD